MRRPASERTWAEPLRWNRAAEKAGEIRTVFCASMGDVFEARPELDAVRQRLWKLIDATASLRWLLLTKRPETIDRAVTAVAWLGVTAETQEQADRRIPLLLEQCSATGTGAFVSIEPLLEPLDLNLGGGFLFSSLAAKLEWVIVGDESGKRRRPAKLDWVRSIRDQCIEADVPFFFKQWHDDAGKHEMPLLDGVRWGQVPW